MKVFVACASNKDVAEKYLDIARRIGTEIAKHGWDLIYGGCGKGMMLTAANAAHESGRQVIAVAHPSLMYKLEYHDVLYEAFTINERKDKYTALADALLFLPGGMGTVDELMSAFEAKRVGEHDLPIVILNMYGYYDNLLKMFEVIDKEGMGWEADKDKYFVASTIEDAIAYLVEHLNAGQAI